MSNHIDHIEITNFKSIRHQKIEGCKRINVFIGYPNVGKSAILEAISALCYLQKDYNEPYSELCRMKNVSELFYNGNIAESTAIKCSNDINVVFNYLSEKQVDLNILVENEDFLSHSDDVPFEDPFFKQIRFSNDTVHSVASRAKKDIIKVKKYQFQNSFNDYKTNGLNFFFPHGKNLVDIVQFNKDLRKEVGELFKFYDLKLLIDQATNSIRGLRYLDEETIFTIPFYQMADTLQRLIFHKAAIISNKETVLLFEEPEAHMFPPYISTLMADIIQDENNNQYFISTHSPFVLNDLMEDVKDGLSIYAVGLHNGETTVKKISDEEMHEIYQYGIDLFFNLEDYLKDV